MVPWIVGETPGRDNLDLTAAAVALAQFIRALHAVPTAGGPVKSGTARGVPVQRLDAGVRPLIEELRGEVDAGSVTRVWDEAMAADQWEAPLVWIHGDIAPGNLIVRERRLVAVIDFGGLGIGDPAPDLAPALQGLRYYRTSRPDFVATARHQIDAVLTDRS